MGICSDLPRPRAIPAVDDTQSDATGTSRPRDDTATRCRGHRPLGAGRRTVRDALSLRAALACLLVAGLAIGALTAPAVASTATDAPIEGNATEVASDGAQPTDADAPSNRSASEDAVSPAATAAGGAVEWTAGTDGDVVASPTVVEGTAYVADGNGTVTAYDASTGDVEWQFEADFGVEGAPTVADGTVFVGTLGYEVYAIDAESGDVEWNRGLDFWVSGAPTYADGSVYVAAGDGDVHAFDAETGDVEWNASAGTSLVASPTATEDTVYVGSFDQSLYAFDAEDGSQEWQFDTGGSVQSSATVADGTVFVGSDDGSLYAVDPDEGSQEWQFDTGGDVRSTPTVHDGTVYVGSYDETLYAVDADAGSEAWQHDADGVVHSSPTVTEEAVYVGAHDGALYAVDPDDGSEHWQVDAGAAVTASPIVADGSAYVTAGDAVQAVDAVGDGNSVGSRTRLGTLGHVGDREGAPIVAEITEAQLGAWENVSVELLDPEDGTVLESDTTGPRGLSVLRVQPGEYDLRAEHETGAYVTPVDHGTDRSFVEIEFDQCTSRDIVYTPVNPTTADEIVFHACPGAGAGTDYWSFGGGGTADGDPVTHSYDEPGTYTVTYGPDTRGYTQGDQREIEVTGAGASIEGTGTTASSTVQGGEITNDVSVRVDTANDPEIESVTIQGAGETFEAEYSELASDWAGPGMEYYHTQIDLNEVDLEKGFHRFDVTVEYEQGSDRDSFAVRVYEPDRYLEWLLDSGTQEWDGSELHVENVWMDYEYSFGLDEELPSSIGLVSDLQFVFAGELLQSATYLPDQQRATLGADSGVYVELLGYDAGLGLDADGSATPDGDYQLDSQIDEVRLGANLPQIGMEEKDYTFHGYGVTIDYGFKGRLLYIFRGFELQTDTLPPTPLDGEYATWGDVSGSGEADARVASVGGSVGIDIHQRFELVPGIPAVPSVPFAVHAAPYGSLGLQIGPYQAIGIDTSEIWDTEDFPGWGPERSEPDWSDLETNDLGGPAAGGDDQSITTRDPSGPTVGALGGDRSTAPGGRPGTQSIHGNTGHEGDARIDRLTDRDLVDETPDVATFDDGHVAAWTAHREDEPAERGQDVAVAVRENGAWSERTWVTPPSNRSHHAPRVATDGEEVLVAWSAVPTDLDEMAELGSGFDVYYAHYDGTDWTEPRQLTNDTEFPTEVDVAPTDDGWVATWEESQLDGGNATAANATVRYARLGTNATEVQRETVDAASAPALSATDGTTTLAYVDADRDDVVRTELTDGGRDVRDRYDVTETPRRIAAGAGHLAWAAENGTIDVVRGDAVERVEPGEGAVGATDVSLVDSDVGVVLAYRSNNGGNSSGSVTYRVLRDGNWSVDRHAIPAGTGYQLRDLSIAPTDDGFLAAVEATPGTTDGVGDVVVAEQPFRPDYVLNASVRPATASPGEDVTVDYTVENAGQAPGDDATLTVEAGDATAASVDLATPLPDGGVTGSETVTVPATGDVTVAVETSTEQHEVENARTTLRPATPSLALEDVETTRVEDEALRVNVTVRNDGPAVATDLPVELRDGTGAVATPTVDAIGAGEFVTVSSTFDLAALNASRADSVVLDPEGELPDAAIAANASRTTETWFVRPNGDLSDHVQYRELADGSVVADVVVSNRGSGPLEGEVVAYDGEADGYVQIGNASVSLAATNDSEPVSRQVRVPLDGVAAGQEVWFDVESTIPDAEAGETRLVDEVGPVQPATGTLDVTVTDAGSGDPIENATVAIDGRETTTDENGSATPSASVGERTLAVDADDYEPTNVSLTVDEEGQAVAVTLVPEDAGPLAAYANQDGVVDVDGLLDAIEDFRTGAIGVDALLDVIDAFRSGEPVL